MLIFLFNHGLLGKKNRKNIVSFTSCCKVKKYLSTWKNSCHHFSHLNFFSFTSSFNTVLAIEVANMGEIKEHDEMING